MSTAIPDTNQQCGVHTTICHIQPVTLCSFCNKTKVSEMNWQHFANNDFSANDPLISHGFCPDCARKHFPTLGWDYV
ncbi:hypothetical protein [Desulforhopalus sp. 52FAK]